VVKLQLWWRYENKFQAKVTGDENVKNRFPAYLREKWIDLPQSKTKMIFFGPFCYMYIVGYISPAEISNFCDIVYVSVSKNLSFTQNLNAVESSYFMWRLLLKFIYLFIT